MKAHTALPPLFSVLGVGLLLGAGYATYSTKAFLAQAVVAPGTVVELVRSRSDSSYTFAPVVRFQDASGAEHEFLSSSGSNPPAYDTGEAVEVLYLPTDPSDARINGWFALWGIALILGGMGAVFLAIGGVFLLVPLLSARRAEQLRQTGQRVETDYQGVDQDLNFTVNGRSPFRILSQWQDPMTKTLHVFRSENLWFDPTEFAKGRRITVYIDPKNPSRHAMDLSFLPKTEGV